MNQKVEGTWAVDYGKVNLKSLIITNDPKLYEKQKAKGEVAVVFEPSVLGQMKADQGTVYLVGLNEVNQKEMKKMEQTEYKEVLRNLLDQMMKRLEGCEPELAPVYVATILDLVERIYALDRKLNV